MISDKDMSMFLVMHKDMSQKGIRKYASEWEAATQRIKRSRINLDIPIVPKSRKEPEPACIKGTRFLKEMDYQLDLFKKSPDEEAIKMIQYFEPLALQQDPRGYCVCTSEGKDSRVLGHLFRRAGVKHFYLHNITGIDPPELVYFQRKNFQKYKDAGYLAYDVMYRKSMWRLMQEKLMPPLRKARYCCEELKERRVSEQGNAVLSFGVRRYESKKRAGNRRELEAVKTKEYIIMPFDNAENRRTFEVCYKDYEKRLNPIAEWTTENIWDYSRYWNLEQCNLYEEGFERLGCIGCPNARRCSREREFERWPRFKKLYLLAFEEMIEERKKRGLKIFDCAQTPEDWFEWWLSDKSADGTDESQIVLEFKDY